ncbi:LysM peptidoglycan-binding domain-containing protein [uncultured Methylobacterium sp.]|uniref:LysM peptidoglycan-binding domain-containing protein n=1 Tax=uncultured Methylobacterium sp. TaxID=157278 RepID=UPI0025960AAB|nr:LysM peptidoglycan-binding domain-containing protein [uncultured Methylobacterium sp.]
MTSGRPTTELRRGLVLGAVGLVAGFVLIGVAASGTRLFSLLSPDAPPPASTPAPVAALPAPAPPAAPVQPAAPEGTPAFDVVRVEPDGSNVVAGRTRPGAEVALMRDGRPFARTTADAAGNFALVPPALPPGTSEITLQSTAPDGTRLTGRDSAVVVVAPDRRAKPLVAVTAPDRPTAVLSLPEAAPGPSGAKVDQEAKVAREARSSADPSSEAKASPKVEARSGGPIGKGVPECPAKEEARPEPVKVVGVDAEAGGRLYVTARGAPKAALRLYLNDTLVAPGQAGPDGRIAFTIGSGVKPGDYRVRVDQVDPASGKVETRAETAFAMPQALGEPAQAPAPAPAAQPAPAKVDPGKVDPGKVAAAKSDSSKNDFSKNDFSKNNFSKNDSSNGDVTRNAPAPSLPMPVPAPTVSRAPADAPAVAAARPSSPAAPDASAPPAAPAPVGETERPPADPGAVFVAGISTAKVVRGDNLWSISRRTYGRGLRYTVIFDANQPQIRDPNRIYPGQVFVLPGETQQQGQGQPPAPEGRG